jgi:hypothetical protein
LFLFPLLYLSIIQTNKNDMVLNPAVLSHLNERDKQHLRVTHIPPVTYLIGNAIASFA